MLASPMASFLSVDAGIGLTPDCGVSFLLPQMIGPGAGFPPTGISVRLH
ncbi:hypothetical protein [Paenarthrobacter sp. PH39-S1]|nr:hypothetical protein [Paenarthrobacter sp. PH39-S1]MDJ0354844.1 hypothetical protein [Paenarthrobacter sp. PH39-S1]